MRVIRRGSADSSASFACAGQIPRPGNTPCSMFPSKTQIRPSRRSDEPSLVCQPFALLRLIRHEGGSPDATRDEHDGGAYGMTDHPALTLIVRVEVHLMPGGVRATVRPPLRRGGRRAAETPPPRRFPHTRTTASMVDDGEARAEGFEPTTSASAFR